VVNLCFVFPYNTSAKTRFPSLQETTVYLDSTREVRAGRPARKTRAIWED